MAGQTPAVQALVAQYIANFTTLDHALEFARKLHSLKEYKHAVKVCDAAQERLRTFEDLREKGTSRY